MPAKTEREQHDKTYDKTNNSSMNISLDQFLIDNKEKSRTRSNFSHEPVPKIQEVLDTLLGENKESAQGTRLQCQSQDPQKPEGYKFDGKLDSQRKLLNQDLVELTLNDARFL